MGQGSPFQYAYPRAVAYPRGAYWEARVYYEPRRFDYLQRCRNEETGLALAQSLLVPGNVVASEQAVADWKASRTARREQLTLMVKQFKDLIERADNDTTVEWVVNYIAGGEPIEVRTRSNV